MNTTGCKICNSSTTIVCGKKILNKYDVNYHQCTNCGFVQTDEPFWLQEAYQSAITSLDIGLVGRNIYLQKEIPKIIDGCFPDAKIMLDYGGGYGMFVRLMRDAGYNFYRQDIYCENLFAKYFDVTDIETKKFDVLTAFEVFEHLNNPLEEIKLMYSFSDNIIFSTVLLPDNIADFNNWWYVSPETGQHIAFYSLKSLQHIANQFKSHLYSNGVNLHVFSKNKLNADEVDAIMRPKPKSLVQKVLNRFKSPAPPRPSLLQSDVEHIKGIIKHK